MSTHDVNTVFVGDDGLRIISPLTFESAKELGKDTEWYKNRNNLAFDMYNEYAPVFIVIMPDDTKLFFWKNKNETVFMDAENDMVDTAYIEQNWSLLKPICEYLKDLNYIPDSEKTYDLCLEFVAANGMNLKYVVEEYKDINMCMTAIANNAKSLKYIPDSIKQSYDFYMQAIKSNPDCFNLVPDMTPDGVLLKDYDMCLKAVKVNGECLSNVPRKYIDKNMCMEAVKQNGKALLDVPNEFKTYDLCLEAVKNNGEGLWGVPKKYKDYNMCMEAVKSGGFAMHYVPDMTSDGVLIKDYNLCLEAVKNSKYAFMDVPENMQNYKLCFEAVKKYYGNIIAVPNALKDYDMCLVAAEQNQKALQYIPEEFLASIRVAIDLKDNELKHKDRYGDIKTFFENAYEHGVSMKPLFSEHLVIQDV